MELGLVAPSAANSHEKTMNSEMRIRTIFVHAK